MNMAPKFDAPKRRRVAAFASERQRGGGQQLEVAARRVQALTDVPVPVHDECGPCFRQDFGEGGCVVQAHADFGGRTLSETVRQREDVMMKEDDLVADRAPGVALSERAQPLELCGTDGAVLPVEGPLPASAGVEADEDCVRLLDNALPGAAGLELQPDARSKVAPPRSLALLRRLRARAGCDRKEVKVMVPRNHKEPAALAPSRKGRRRCNRR